VDVTIAPAPMSLTSESANVTAAVRALSFAPCTLLLVVTPVAIVTEHSWYAFSVAVAAVSVSVAVVCPELAVPAVNSVAPQPLLSSGTELGASSVLANWNDGSTSAMLSAGAAVPRGAFRAKLNVIDDSAAVTGLAITSLLCWNAAVGAATAVDVVIDEVAAAMSVADARVTATVRVLKFAA
jgi:hypothetical protein